MEFFPSRRQNAAPDGEADALGQDGHKSRPQKPV
jgi:hypothetical protein